MPSPTKAAPGAAAPKGADAQKQLGEYGRAALAVAKQFRSDIEKVAKTLDTVSLGVAGLTLPAAPKSPDKEADNKRKAVISLYESKLKYIDELRKKTNLQLKARKAPPGFDVKDLFKSLGPAMQIIEDGGLRLRKHIILKPTFDDSTPGIKIELKR